MESQLLKQKKIVRSEIGKIHLVKTPLKHNMGFENSPKCPTSFPFSDIFMQKRALTGDTMVVSQST